MVINKKTLNNWQDRDNFQAHSRKYTYLPMDHSEDNYNQSNAFGNSIINVDDFIANLVNNLSHQMNGDQYRAIIDKYKHNKYSFIMSKDKNDKYYGFDDKCDANPTMNIIIIDNVKQSVNEQESKADIEDKDTFPIIVRFGKENEWGNTSYSGNTGWLFRNDSMSGNNHWGAWGLGKGSNSNSNTTNASVNNYKKIGSRGYSFRPYQERSSKGRKRIYHQHISMATETVFVTKSSEELRFEDQYGEPAAPGNDALVSSNNNNNAWGSSKYVEMSIKRNINDDSWEMGYPFKIWITKDMKASDIYQKFVNYDDQKKLQIQSCLVNGIEMEADDVIFEKIHESEVEHKTHQLVILLRKISKDAFDFDFKYQFEWTFEDDKDKNDNKNEENDTENVTKDD